MYLRSYGNVQKNSEANIKIVNVTNDNLVIQARNKKDFEKAKLVANEMEEQNKAFVVCSECEYEFWVQVTASWDNFQTKDFKDAYQVAKAEALKN